MLTQLISFPGNLEMMGNLEQAISTKDLTIIWLSEEAKDPKAQLKSKADSTQVQKYLKSNVESLTTENDLMAKDYEFTLQMQNNKVAKYEHALETQSYTVLTLTRKLNDLKSKEQERNYKLNSIGQTFQDVISKKRI